MGGSKATKVETTTAFDWTNSALRVETKWDGKDPPTIWFYGSGSKGLRAALNESSKDKYFQQKFESTLVATRVPEPKPQRFEIPAGSRLYLRNVKCRSTALKPIFNGKDLSDWKEIPGRNSKFTVTKNGELSIKDGPGDIHTEGQWDNFLLQLDIKANGKHLNSGVFFRCLSGQFWSGYESQIRNQWKGDDRTKPVDFGTGGIYGRQPARKVVSSDNEWFTMTVIAHGNHIATWVNGYQVTDFTDTRPKNESARKGTKLDKGPISLQGHDPTTDLSFRNIRIVDLPKKKN